MYICNNKIRMHKKRKKPLTVNRPVDGTVMCNRNRRKEKEERQKINIKIIYPSQASLSKSSFFN